jgi:class 3 adenylate cyclase
VGNQRVDTPFQGRPGIRTFLIADVRGYTLFTHERGDEAATKLAARFAQIAREVVDEHGGSVIELRGDEALAVFDSARQAILAAAHAQDRFLEETLADPAFPLPVGIGLDAGEAVPLEAGYRGGALNLAARLCGRAGPGEILTSQGVIHLARRVEGVRYVPRGPAPQGPGRARSRCKGGFRGWRPRCAVPGSRTEATRPGASPAPRGATASRPVNPCRTLPCCRCRCANDDRVSRWRWGSEQRGAKLARGHRSPDGAHRPSDHASGSPREHGRGVRRGLGNRSQ